MKINFGIEQIKKEQMRMKVIEPGWYKGMFGDKFDVKPSKDGNSVNYNVKVTVQFKGVDKDIYHLFNTKAVGFWIDAIAAGNNMTKEAWLKNVWEPRVRANPDEDLEPEILKLVGRKAQFYVTVDADYDPLSPQNKVGKFAPFDAVTV